MLQHCDVPLDIKPGGCRFIVGVLQKARELLQPVGRDLVAVVVGSGGGLATE
jgi:hypothetical protein